MSRSGRRKPAERLPINSADLFVRQSPDDFYIALEGMVTRSNLIDFPSASPTGKLVLACFEFMTAMATEDIVHYFLYCGDGWTYADKLFRLVGAADLTKLFADVRSMVKNGEIPASQEVRFDQFLEIENNPVQIAFLEETYENWPAQSKNLKLLLQNYVVAHREEFEHFIDYCSTLELPNLCVSDAELSELVRSERDFPFADMENLLIDVDRLPLLLRLAATEDCTLKWQARIIRALYAVTGSSFSDSQSHKGLKRLGKLQSAIEQGKSSKNFTVREWALRSEEFVRAPDAQLSLQWMSARA